MTAPTLHDLQTAGVVDIFAYCSNCRRSGRMPLASLLSKAEPGTEFPTLKARVRCQKCGHRGVDLQPCYPGQPGAITRHTD